AAARRAWPDGELGSFRDAFAVLLRQMRVPADAARAALRRHAQPNPELDAFESAAQIEKKITLTTVDGASSDVFTRIDRAQQAMRKLPMFSPAEMLGSAEEFLIHRDPAEAARFDAQVTAKEHRMNITAQIAAERA